MGTPSTTLGPAAPSRVRAFARRWVTGDEAAHVITMIFGAAVILITTLLVYQLWVNSAASRAKFGLNFFRRDRVIVRKFILRSARPFALLASDADGGVVQQSFTHGEFSGPRAKLRLHSGERKGRCLRLGSNSGAEPSMASRGRLSRTLEHQHQGPVWLFL